MRSPARLFLAAALFAAAGTLAHHDVGAAATRTLSLGDAVATARTRQPDLAKARAQTDAARARVDQSNAPLRPQVTGNATYSLKSGNFPGGPVSLEPTNSLNFGATASQTLWDPVTKRRAAASGAQADATFASERTTDLDLVLSVRTAYFTAWATHALVGVAQETLDNQDKHLHQIQGFVEVGTRPEIDLAQARTDVANARVALINAQNDHETALAELAQAMGLGADPDFDVTNETLPPVDGEDGSIDELYAEALKARPELAVLVQERRSDELTLDSVSHGRYPTVGASFGVNAATGLDPTGLAPNWNFTVSLFWPIWNGGGTDAQVHEAQANLISLDADTEKLRQAVRLDVSKARLAVRAAKAELTASDEALSGAKERMRLAEGRYQTGVGNIIELGDAQVALTAAAAQRVQAEFKLAVARAQLLHSLGRA